MKVHSVLYLYLYICVAVCVNVLAACSRVYVVNIVLKPLKDGGFPLTDVEKKWMDGFTVMQ